MLIRLGDALLSASLPQGRRALIGVTSGSSLGRSENKATFTCTPIFVKGMVELLTNPGGSLGGCVVGIIQLQFIETSRFRYRGRTREEGSVFVDRAAARPRQLCRDTATVGEGRATLFHGVHPPAAWNPFWYANPAEPQGVDPAGDLMRPTRFLAATDVANANGRLVVRTDEYDCPGDECRLIVDNSATGEENFLREAELEFHFCTILAAVLPGSSFRIEPIRHLYWNVVWHALFEPGLTLNAHWSFTPTGLHGMHVQSRSHSGAPNDRRFCNEISNTGLANCNAVAFQTFHRPVVHPPSRDWRWASQ